MKQTGSSAITRCYTLQCFHVAGTNLVVPRDVHHQLKTRVQPELGRSYSCTCLYTVKCGIAKSIIIIHPKCVLRQLTEMLCHTVYRKQVSWWLYVRTHCGWSINYVFGKRSSLPGRSELWRMLASETACLKLKCFVFTLPYQWLIKTRAAFFFIQKLPGLVN